MINFENAKQIADDHLKTFKAPTGHVLVVIESLTKEESFGWVFFFNTARYVQTRDLSYSLMGNLPLVVLKQGGIRRLPISPNRAYEEAVADLAATLKREGEKGST